MKKIVTVDSNNNLPDIVGATENSVIFKGLKGGLKGNTTVYIEDGDHAYQPGHYDAPSLVITQPEQKMLLFADKIEPYIALNPITYAVTHTTETNFSTYVGFSNTSFGSHNYSVATNLVTVFSTFKLNTATAYCYREDDLPPSFETLTPVFEKVFDGTYQTVYNFPTDFDWATTGIQFTTDLNESITQTSNDLFITVQVFGGALGLPQQVSGTAYTQGENTLFTAGTKPPYGLNSDNSQAFALLKFPEEYIAPNAKTLSNGYTILTSLDSENLSIPTVTYSTADPSQYIVMSYYLPDPETTFMAEVSKIYAIKKVWTPKA